MHVPSDRPRWLLFWDALMVLAAAASVGLVFYYDTTKDATLRARLLWFDWGFVALFLFDFLWDIQRSDDRVKFLKRNWWALFGMIPLAVGELGFLRLFRIFRILRVLRAFRSIGEFLGSIQRALKGGHVTKLAIVSGSITLTGSLLVWIVERNEPGTQMPHYGDALWWAMATVTTIGYGDVIPHTVLGRIIAAFLMVTGVGTIGLLAGQVGSTLVGRQDEKRMEAQVAETATSTVAGQLSALASLHSSGALTDEEFKQAKARVLAEG